MDGELNALATITVNRVLELVTGDIHKTKIKDLSVFNDLKDKWTPRVRELYLNMYSDFKVQYQNSLTNSK